MYYFSSMDFPDRLFCKGCEEILAKMKKSALFINCARGPIVDNKALADALNEGRIAGAAINVYDMEPPIPAKQYF